ncbi:Vps51/Vps67-domain-containing protein [Cercophora newfieldiana]|uniref:Vacuolar protein sorting-associated protein 51 homolog n=1 Tax=Cercophora newfieldiana TaxID=92897 RepID=A0AA40CS57_9PEZI|nr:Vps51/Vps67-domain-containing protein [Cercophora newfieldiana]
MSTIASPRDPSSTPLTRRLNNPPQASTTPTSSTRPSLDIPSTSSSPNPNNHTLPPPGPAKRANRAALREYYNLKKSSTPSTPTVEITNPHASDPDTTLDAHSELDAPDFNAQSYISSTLASSTLSELLRTYARVLGEIRALDAEKKALVYDNYSKLISATETIRRMRSTMDPLNPMAGTLDLVWVEGGVKEGGAGAEGGGGRGRGGGRRARTREFARGVLEVPGRLRGLVDEGREEEARREWEMPRRLLERWRELGVGGADVETLIEEGDAIVGRGEEGSGSESDESGSASTT